MLINYLVFISKQRWVISFNYKCQIYKYNSYFKVFFYYVNQQGKLFWRKN